MFSFHLMKLFLSKYMQIINILLGKIKKRPRESGLKIVKYLIYCYSRLNIIKKIFISDIFKMQGSFNKL